MQEDELNNKNDMYDDISTISWMILTLLLIVVNSYVVVLACVDKMPGLDAMTIIIASGLIIHVTANIASYDSSLDTKKELAINILINILFFAAIFAGVYAVWMFSSDLIVSFATAITVPFLLITAAALNDNISL